LAPTVYGTNGIHIYNNKKHYIEYVLGCQQFVNYFTAVKVEASTFTPGPIVVVTVMFFM
jgi:16S rRNA A1518/A1519 N6-dimethyltransferase RsmA/KsgA/DIM1 with predicted DNA glycosylase/AP lyase activity